jgi:hypothetical protein
MDPPTIGPQLSADKPGCTASLRATRLADISATAPLLLSRLPRDDPLAGIASPALIVRGVALKDDPSSRTAAALDLHRAARDGLFRKTRPVYCPMMVPLTHLLFSTCNGPQSSADTWSGEPACDAV